MRAYLARRLIILPALLFGISIISFALLNFAPGDPAEIILRRENPEQPPLPEVVRALRVELGLAAPLPQRYGQWLFGVLKGDLGESYRSGAPIMNEMLKRFPATAMLATASLALSIAVSIPLGIVAAVWRGSFIDVLSRLLALLGAAVPSYVLALLLMLFISVKLNWLPAIGYGSPGNLILPAIALGAGGTAQLMRLTRASMLEVLQQDYMRTARAKGLTERSVVIVHGLKNGLLPVVTIVGINIGHLLGGTVIVETIFGWPGVGRYAVESILQRDYPVVQAFVLYMAVIFLLANLAVDISYRWLDPRLHFGRIST